MREGQDAAQAFNASAIFVLIAVAGSIWFFRAARRPDSVQARRRLHERLGGEIGQLLRLMTAPREERRHTGHICEVHGLKLSQSTLWQAFTLLRTLAQRPADPASSAA
jgi:hypothetical protein